MNLKGLVRIDDSVVVRVEEIEYFFFLDDKEHYRCEITFKSGNKVWTTATVAEVWTAINDTPEEKVE